ncbi:hypothetical protein PARPLA_02966 [Rhodobacteraceae bacterium THAF1]|uniref:hypothetical protein n=1 Tax=Palleronia sp. THAF1 TaxID=2587842 RepID=UPI000F3FB82E|nr:hypothetical protein [Palleronia sp. THAF1]QFU08367.1 hypothetical protein FIU81_06740 [Palleronia sp. THAF1]VDC29070.1 hypothetical protein PARPLA_02966 [Rhodobacteraceae bacterium THAF1]
MFKFITIALALLAAPALAEDYCRATLNADEILIDRDTLDRDAPGLRERLGRWPTKPIDRLRGRDPACDSETLISFLSLNVPEEEIDGYCLLPDPEFGYLLAPGARDYRGRCTATTCERVNTARDGAVGVAGTTTDILTRRGADQSRTQAIKHASGAAILTGSAGSILASLGTGASTAMTAALAAPVVAGAAAVSVVAVGGAVWLCR